jgi:hypothetical protein
LEAGRKISRFRKRRGTPGTLPIRAGRPAGNIRNRQTRSALRQVEDGATERPRVRELTGRRYLIEEVNS